MSLRYFLLRLLQVVPAVAGILAVAFLLIHLAPGDPVLAVAGEHGDAAYYEHMRERFGLDEPVHRRLGTYAARVATGDLGFSHVQGRPVLEVIRERVPATLLLTGTALLLGLLTAVPLGMYAAVRSGSARDVLLNAGALGFYSAPVFWIAQLAVILVALRLPFVPSHGMTTPGSDPEGLAHAADVLRHLALPVLVLASQEVAALFRLTRSGLVEELERDHIRTARAKGLTEARVLVLHALPRALLPVITVVGARTGHLLAGAAVVEIVFGWPGIGRLLLTALQTRDTPILLGIFLVVSFAVVLANLIADLIHAAVDPRVRYH